MKKLALCFSILLALLLPLPSLRAQEPSTVRVVIPTWGGWGPVMVAKQKGFFGSLDVQVQVVDDFKAYYALYGSDQCEVAGATVDMMVMAANPKPMGKVFFVGDISRGGDAVVSTPSIRTLADLKGKRIAYVRGGPSHVLIDAILTDAGLSFADITPVLVDDPSLGAMAFLSGKVDACATWEPYIGQLVQSGKGAVLKSSAHYPDLMVDCLWGSNQFLADKKISEQFVEGWLRGMAFCIEHPDEAAAIMAREFKTKPEEMHTTFRGIAWGTPQINREQLMGPQPKALVLFERIAKLFVAQSVIAKAPPPAGNFFTDQAAPVFERMEKEFSSTK